MCAGIPEAVGLAQFVSDNIAKTIRVVGCVLDFPVPRSHRPRSITPLATLNALFYFLA